MRRLLLGFVLADFAALNAYVVYQIGYLGFLQAVFANLATTAAFVDLVIALALVSAWLWQDAQRRGVSALPYLALTAVFGSAGPLLYLLQRPDESPAPQGVAAARAA